MSWAIPITARARNRLGSCSAHLDWCCVVGSMDAVAIGTFLRGPNLRISSLGHVDHDKLAILVASLRSLRVVRCMMWNGASVC